MRIHLSNSFSGDLAVRIGLCAKCHHAKTITSDRGRVFVMCGLSKTDKSFPKYPSLPVLTCRGFVEIQFGEDPHESKNHSHE